MSNNINNHNLEIEEKIEKDEYEMEINEYDQNYIPLLKEVIKKGLAIYSKDEVSKIVEQAIYNDFESKMMREYRDRFFRLLFSDKKRLLSLYNSLNHTNYEKEEDLIVVSTEFGICIGMRSDVAFVLVSELNIYEAQATKNYNMPLRMLFYVADMYRNRILHRDLFRRGRVKIENPNFITFYNGDEKMEEDEVILKLSDSYMKKTDDPALELKVRVININNGHNKELLETCESLKGYSDLLEVVKQYRKKEPVIDKAVVSAINYCIDNGILKDFLRKYREEVISMLKDFYSFEDYRKDVEEELDTTKEELDTTKEELDTTKEELDMVTRMLVNTCRASGQSDEQIISELVEGLGITKEKAEKKLKNL